MPHPVGPVAPSASAKSAASGTPARLPWPEGALLPATIETASGAGNEPATPGAEPRDMQGNMQRAMLSLPGMRLTASLPPGARLPAGGTVWLQLMDRTMPARFRLLGAAEAARILGEALERLARNAGTAAGREPTGEAGQAANTLHSEMPGLPPGARTSADWPLNLAGLPWLGQADERRMSLRDEDGAERGMLLREAGDQGFRLLGRLDLPHLGPVLFRLAGGSEDAANWSLTLHAPDARGRPQLRRAFPGWLREQSAARPGLHGALLDAWPEDEAWGGLEHRA